MSNCQATQVEEAQFGQSRADQNLAREVNTKNLS